ncbi:MAG TPA: substrate-binding domain-containing protein [Candidatus Didemnitutus sp.]|nr:substrate-binding domain-containing protein [Candidatus Didemnitutus sp.]
MERPITIGTVTQVTSRLGLEIAKGAGDYAHEQGWATMRFDNRTRSEGAGVKNARLNGLIVQAFVDAPVAPFLRLGLPVVNVTNSRPELKLPRVAPDDERVGVMAADYFLGRGFKHFAFCGARISGAAELRGRGFIRRCEESGYSVDVLRGEYVLSAAYGKKSKLKDLGAWLGQLKGPVGLLGWTDDTCDTIINLCRAQRLRVPEQISILGVNNDFSRLADHMDYALSSIDLGGHEIGYRAAEMLHRLIRGKPAADDGRDVLVPPLRIVERRSTDYYAVDDAPLAAALSFIKRNYHQPFQIEELARAAKLSRRVLEKRFRSKLNSSPYEEVMRQRIERAKSLLLTTSLKIQEIGSLCGYDTGSNFTLFFTDKVGCSPSEFRRKVA